MSPVFGAHGSPRLLMAVGCLLAPASGTRMWRVAADLRRTSDLTAIAPATPKSAPAEFVIQSVDVHALPR